jgi:hypothetical protein
MLFSYETRRVQHYLDGALAVLRARDVSSLSDSVRGVRALMIEELRRYRDAAVFPMNNVRRARTPVFIDPFGTRCAMAHLLEVCGFHGLVARVARTNNLARIRELASDPELLWALAAMGLTVAEAARVQPSYETSCNDGKSCFCSGNGALAKASLIAEVTSSTQMPELSKVKVLEVFGASSFAVGDTLDVAHYSLLGSKVLITETASQGTRWFADIGRIDNHVQCAFTSVDARLAARAMSSADCAGVLERGDERFDCSVSKDNDGMCSYQPAPRDGGGFFVLALLLAVYKTRTAGLRPRLLRSLR